jgi:hypothetical protein
MYGNFDECGMWGRIVDKSIRSIYLKAELIVCGTLKKLVTMVANFTTFLNY